VAEADPSRTALVRRARRIDPSFGIGPTDPAIARKLVKTGQD
jgi:hypothetical protein